jgi:glyoxylase-like metal-dependent hydrolase (beta-lactamase superfamily II)
VLVASEFEEVTMIKMAREVESGPPYWCAAFLVDGLLVDTGCAHTAAELVAFLEDRRVDLIVNTHYHEDHVGANQRIQEERHIPIYAHPDALPLIGSVPTLLPYRELIWGTPEASAGLVIPDVIQTEHFRFRVLDTPGHCRGHISLIEPDRGWAFSGDAYVTGTPKGARPEEDVGQIVRDMRGLVDLNCERLVLFNAVGSIVKDGRRALRDCSSYLVGLTREVKEHARKGLSPEEIRDAMFGDETSLAALTQGDFSMENLVRSALRADI